MSKGIFVTGTGTDIGKTFVTALIVKKLCDQNLCAGYYKAALSGAEKVHNTLIAGDCAYVAKVAGLKNEPNSLTSYIYEQACSPHLAAELNNKPIEWSKIMKDWAKSQEQFDYITMEGAGGLVCPLRLDDDEKIMMTDVIKKLGLAIIIVAPAELGTINNCLLTVEYARSLDINIQGIILNNFDEQNYIHQDNKKRVEELTGIKIIACVEKNAQDLAIDGEILAKLYKEIV